MTELEKDLDGFDCKVCPYKARLEKEHGDDAVCWQWTDGSCSIYALQWAAARLAELGYVKVVRCGKCVYEKHCLQRIHNRAIGLAEDLDYCSEGERVVAKDATGGEGPNA